MDDKLQEKFALVQQMRREKELKEAKAKESQPFDIFSIAGVTLPTSGSAGGLNMTIRHDSQSTSGSGVSIGSVKRPRKERTNSTNLTTEESSQASVGGEDSSNGQKPKLKRSSMAARSNAVEPEIDAAMESGSQQQPSASAESTGQEKSQSPSTATPPTPIPSPPNDGSSRRNSGSSSPTKLLAKDMTHNVQSRSGSIDENEEMVIDMFGRSVPRSRHHSSDEGSDSESDMAHPRRRRRTRMEDDELDRYRPSYQRSGRYGSRSRSRSRSRSYSPGGRRHHRRSRSRSVSPYYPHAREGDRRRRGGGRRGGDREGRDRHSGDEVPPRNPAEEVDPYQAASRYLDTAFYPTKIYVGNLPSSISLTSLRTLFAPFGDIEDMNLVEGKDFGFVTYVEPIGAQQALAKMNGAMLDGTYIRVNRAKIPERNRRGFAGVAWMDEDGELARLEEEQHQQAAAIAGTLLATGSTPFSPSHSRSESSSSSHHHQHREDRHRSSSSAGMASADRSGHPRGSSTSSRAVSPTPVRSAHQLPTRPRSPKLPPRPTGAASFPPVGVDPRAAMAGRSGGRQILRYDDL
ncbi:hypothetical protein BG015_012077 [Linnemannia schmuckeri]|uniref:RRM domain-containing protein n=1 Tax=Linnemannia schmuckeri TaxID=64567 RepID=A0A9P5S4L7_9FUNG|nr:hypothetical protein BG015_012077 [Linnemannia schmuckeri]